MRGIPHGRGHDHRSPEVDPDSPEGHYIGMSGRTAGATSPIPGGEQHLTNAPTVRQLVPAPVSKPEHRGIMAHGMPPDTHTGHERGDAERGPNSHHATTPEPHHPDHEASARVPPVPVVIVQEGRDVQTLRSSSHRRLVLPAAGGEPVRLVGRNSDREEVSLLNEDATHNIRFASTIGDLNGPQAGTVLPATTSSYLRLKTQDELYAVSDDDSLPAISVIEVFERSGGEVQ
jgi:hypothetical protein